MAERALGRGADGPDTAGRGGCENGEVEPAQPADRVPADRLPTGDPGPGEPGETDAAPTAGPARVEPAGTDAASAAGPARVDPAPTDPDAVAQPALVESTGAVRPSTVAEPSGAASLDPPAPPAAVDARRSDRSPKDMAISLLVLLIPIALLLAFYRGFLGGDQPTQVDPSPAIEQAQGANAFPVSQPTGLGDDWRTVNARYQEVEGGSTLRIGYVTPEGQGAQLVQSNVPAERLIPAELSDRAQPQGQTDLDGRSWQRYTARQNEQALVLLEPGRTVIVVGDARENELRRLASSLR